MFPGTNNMVKMNCNCGFFIDHLQLEIIINTNKTFKMNCNWVILVFYWN